MRDKKLAAQFRAPCIICQNPGEGDHIKAYAGNPTRDTENNFWSLCRPHHAEKHQTGLVKFTEKYRLWSALKERGFYFCDLGKCYRHEKF